MSLMATRFTTCPISAVFGHRSEDIRRDQTHIEFAIKKFTRAWKKKKEIVNDDIRANWNVRLETRPRIFIPCCPQWIITVVISTVYAFRKRSPSFKERIKKKLISTLFNTPLPHYRTPPPPPIAGSPRRGFISELSQARHWERAILPVAHFRDSRGEGRSQHNPHEHRVDEELLHQLLGSQRRTLSQVRRRKRRARD